MKETWIDVPFDPAYEVSDQGRVASKARTVRCGPSSGTRRIPEKILRPFSSPAGYLQVHLSRHLRMNVHALVAAAFLPEPKYGMVANHKNGDKVDNRLQNLEWVTQSENHLHSYRELGRAGSCSGKTSGQHPTSKAVVRICLRTGERKVYECASDAVCEGGFDSGQISRCCHGKSSSHKGYRWEFASEPAKKVHEEYRRAA